MAGETPNTGNAGGTGTGTPPPSGGVNRELINNLTDGPKAGDFVKVGDKLYTPTEIQGLVAEREKAANEAAEARKLASNREDLVKKVWSNPENPDRDALKQLLVLAGRSVDEADAIIADELGPVGGAANGKPAKEEEKPQAQDNWGTRAWIQSEFEKSATSAFESSEVLKKHVEAAMKREDDPKMGKEAAEYVKNDILNGLSVRADRILKERVRLEGAESFKRSPVAWFNQAMKQAAEEEAANARKRYGDPNRVGTISSAPHRDPIVEYLEANKPKAKFGKFDPTKDSETSAGEFGDRLAHAILSGYTKGQER